MPDVDPPSSGILHNHAGYKYSYRLHLKVVTVGIFSALIPDIDLLGWYDAAVAGRPLGPVAEDALVGAVVLDLGRDVGMVP